ncbi:MAG TPA: hypothetical protein VNU24_01125 [Solirubrobacteraceae bacterium]|nr:hypothetical protein [Solirubrobacteraceae bacterium]
MQIPGLDDEQLLGDSMLEEIRRTAERRLHQIEPLIEEAERLRDVLEVLARRSVGPGHGTLASAGNPMAAERARKPAPIQRVRGGNAARTATRRRGTSTERAAKGSNKRAILALAADKPGITASQISQLTGMKRTVVASTVSRLKRYGELLDHETGGVCVPATAGHPVAAAPVTDTTPEPALRSPRPRRLTPLQQRRAA